MGNVEIEGLHPGCREGGDCCPDPCGPVYVHIEANQPAEADVIVQEQAKVETDKAKKLGRLHSFGRKIMSTLA